MIFLLSKPSIAWVNFYYLLYLRVQILENPVLISGFGNPVPKSVLNSLTDTKTNYYYLSSHAEIRYDSYLYAYELFATRAGLLDIYVLINYV